MTSLKSLPSADFTTELVGLLVFTAQVAMAIRMNSAYNADRDPRTAGPDVMWLSDALHHFDHLAHAIQSGNRANIRETCDGLVSLYSFYTSPLPGYKSDPRDTFKRVSDRVRLPDALAIFHAIKTKAATIKEVQ